MIKEKIKNIKNNIGSKKLIIVSKNRSIDEILDAYNTGHRDFGENKVQELIKKYEKLPKDIKWHMIGHLQKNKVKHISKFISLIHSLDRLSLAKEIDKNGRKDNRSIDCLIQIKISNDESKYGLNPEQLDSFYSDLKDFENINVIGLMAMATYTKDQSLIADEFKKMEKLFKKMKTIDSNFKILSIGMSDDYQLAINNGSNMIRVGSKIFGQRNY